MNRRDFLIGAAVAPVAAVGAGVPAMEIARRQAYHTGGIVKAREYAAIMQPGEKILTHEQARRAANDSLARYMAAIKDAEARFL